MTDIVITWVDGSDPAWQREKAHWTKESADGPEKTGTLPSGIRETDADPDRYRDWGFLKYLFRGIDAYAPWARRVHLVTAGQKPDWLNVRAPRLHLTDHRDFLRPEHLPTFNSNAIEVNLHRIPGLAEQFVYFNDDMLLTAPVREEDFFRDGLPVDMLALQPVVANPENPVMSSILLNDSVVISRHFRKWENMRKQPGAYLHIGYPPMYFVYNLLERAFPKYTGFYTVHGPSPLLRETFRTLWQKEPEVLLQTSAHRLRSREDVTQYLFREWQKQAGEFRPRNVQRDFAYYDLSEHNTALYRALLRHRKKMICINDSKSLGKSAETVRVELLSVLERVFPAKSAFEV